MPKLKYATFLSNFQTILQIKKINVANFPAKNRKVEKSENETFFEIFKHCGFSPVVWNWMDMCKLSINVKLLIYVNVIGKREILNSRRRKCILERLREYRKIVPSVF